MTLLSHYFQPDTDPAVIRAAAGDWWEVLGHYPRAAVAAACTEYLRDEPKVRPTPGAIRFRAIQHLDREALVNRVALAAPVEPERVRVTPEAAARILAEHGMTTRRIAAILNGRAMPRPGQATWDDEPAEVKPEPTTEQIAARPYTDAERARMAALGYGQEAAE